ncbi:MAG: cation-translocating P-type ATPase [Deltaproteobacteria bacterium]|nr:cation-translocating P-type ATPase [Deltaproteobacteria bacterium]
MGDEAAALIGLTRADASTRLTRDGPNALPTEKRQSLLGTIGAVLREPMLLLLLAAGGLYLVLGDLAEAITLLSFVIVVITITLVQERRTERALTTLRDLSSPRALVIRDGERVRIPGIEVVRGDLVVLGEGDRVPADAVLREASNLQVDESLLTGESAPVRKRAGTRAPSEVRPGGDDLPLVYSGTVVVRGHGIAEVMATGSGTELGKIGRALHQIETEATPMQREVRRVVRAIALSGVGLCAALVLIYGLTRGDWLQGLLAGIALAMAVLPEEFPVVLTIFFAIGAWRIAKSRVLTRRMPALETLGSATVLCTDKTGTLTENRMHVARLWTPATAHEVRGGALPEEVHELVELGILASQRDPFDPTEIAFHRLGTMALAGTEHLHQDWELVREYPLSPELLSVSHVWRAPDHATFVVAAKGAPEAMADICHLDAPTTTTLRSATAELATAGFRVLAVARATFSGELPPHQHDFSFELVGLVGLADPVRQGVPQAIEECKAAGVRVVMITGDYPDTARAIGREIGLADEDGLLTGAEIDRLDDVALGTRLEQTTVVARAVPEQKLRIVRALKSLGEVVAMTGDGVNDAPALKAAHIGVAMGGRGTDVARESSALVVTDDDFTSIVAAVRLGRRIFDNLQRAMAYIIAVHIPIAGLSLLPVLLGWPLVLLPIHIVFLELMIDPACSIAFEAEPDAPDLMKRPPRDPGRGIFDRRMLAVGLGQGAALLAATMLVLAWAQWVGSDANAARALTFTALLAGNIALILVNRSWSQSAVRSLSKRNTAAWLVSSGAALLLILALTAPAVRQLFQFSALPLEQVGIALAVGAASLAWFEVLKHQGRVAARRLTPP